MKNAINFDSYVNSVSDIANVSKLQHKDAFRLVDEDEHTICYFHVRKYKVDIYVHDSMKSLFKSRELLDCSSKNYHKFIVRDENDLHDSLCKINTEYTKRKTKKSSKKSDSTK